jgi:hypothetical protein
MAFRRVVKLRHAQAIGREFVEMRSLDFTAVTTEIRKAKIIHHHKEDIRFWRGVGGEGEEKEKEK